MAHDTGELISYLQAIAEKSSTGDIPWTQPSPSVFTWNEITGPDNFQVTIQKAVGPKKGPGGVGLLALQGTSYLFQVQDKVTRQVVLSISSAERPEFDMILAYIFEGAEKSMDKRSGEILKRLLQNRP